MLKNLKDINWNHLYTFYEVGNYHSLKKASEVMGVSSATASEQIKKLEQVIGLRLFNRAAGGLQLTNKGEELYQLACKVFHAGSKLLDKFSSGAVGGYPVTVGIIETISNDVAEEFTGQFWDLFTHYGTVNTSRQLDHGVLLENIINGAVDWGISLREPKRKGLDSAQIGSFSLTFLCSTELYNKFIQKEGLLQNIPLGLATWDEGTRRTIIEHLNKHEVFPKEIVHSDHFGYLYKLCMRSRLITCVAHNPLEKYKGLKTFHVGEPIKVNLYAIWKKSSDDLISIQQLKNLIHSQYIHVPSRYNDPDLQIEASDVSDELLKD